MTFYRFICNISYSGTSNMAHRKCPYAGKDMVNKDAIFQYIILILFSTIGADIVLFGTKKAEK